MTEKQSTDLDMSLEEQIARERNNIYELRKDLQKNAHMYSPEEYEKTTDYIYAMQTVVEKLQKQLKEEILGKLEKGFGLEIEEQLESMLKNPYMEENFKIEKDVSGNYIVRSDSKKYGEKAIVYENRDRNECVDYIEERQPAKKPEYYVIENLHDYMEGKNENIIRGTLEECLEKYSEFVQNAGLNIAGYKDRATCTLGVVTDRNEMDLVHFINGASYVGTDIVQNQEYNTNKYILDDVEAIVDILELKVAVEVKGNSVEYVPIDKLDGKEVFNGHLRRTIAEKKGLEESVQGRFINGVLLPKTGYKGAPEVTQEKLDVILQNGSKDLNLQGCYISGVTLQGKFENANFENCYFSDCRFENAEFVNTSFKNASINSVDVTHVKLSQTSFECAGITNSRWEDTHFKDVDFINCTWKNISTSALGNPVSFQNCDFLLTDMNSVYIEGSKVLGEMKNLDTVYVTMSGATNEEITKHRKSVMETLNSGEKEILDFKNYSVKSEGEKKQQPKNEKSKASDKKFSAQKQNYIKKARSR